MKHLLNIIENNVANSFKLSGIALHQKKLTQIKQNTDVTVPHVDEILYVAQTSNCHINSKKDIYISQSDRNTLQTTLAYQHKIQNLLYNTNKAVVMHSLAKANFSSNIGKKEKMQIAAGVSSFIELITKSDKIADKTLLIKKIIEDPSKVILMTCPRRWGKSLNLDMLKCFLEIKVGSDGNILKKEDTIEHQIFTKTTTDFYDKAYLPLNISKAEDKIISKQGSYPVIFINLKDCKGNTYQEFENAVKNKIFQIFESHSYLSKSQKLDEHEKAKFEKYLAEQENLIQMKDGLRFLSSLLRKHYDTKVWILIDEYDAPINSMYLENTGIKDPIERQKVIALYKDILSCVLKDNDVNLEKAVLTGILRTAKGTALSGLNNITEYSFSDMKYAGLYGFTQEDVNELFDVFEVPKDSSENDINWREEFKNKYNGYRTQDPKKEIYNAWSIVRALNSYYEYKNQDIKDPRKYILCQYWEESGSSNFIKNFLKHPHIAREITNLVKGNKIEFRMINPFAGNHMEDLEKLVNGKDNVIFTDETKNLLFTYMKLTGYLDEDYSEQTPSGNSVLRIPNSEIKEKMKERLTNYYNEVFYKIPREVVNEARFSIENLFNSDLKSHQKENFISEKLTEFLKYVDQETKINEDLIHNIFNSLIMDNAKLKYMGSEYYIGGNRADTAFFMGTTGVIAEFKYKDSADAAIKQIKEQKYYEIFQQYNTSKMRDKINSIILLGVSLNPNRTIKVKSEVHK